MLHISGWILSILFMASTLTGCGGGSGSSSTHAPTPPPAPVIEYTGLTTPAVITEANAEDLAFGSLLGVESGAAFTLSAGLREKPDKTISSRPNAIDLPLALRKAAQKVSAANSRATASRVLAFTETDTIIGSCGGTADSTLDIDDATGAFEGTVVFSRYCEDGITLSGDTDVDGTVDPATGEIVMITYAFESLAVDGFIYKGTISVDASAAPQIITLDLLAKENASGEVYRIRNYILSVTEISAVELQIEATGTYYDPDLGYVDISTPEPLWVTADDWPASGILLCLGDQNTKARLTAVDSSSFRLQADANGDDVYDYDSGVLPWPEQINPASWQQKASLPIRQSRSAVAAVDGKIYVMGGSDNSDTEIEVNLVQAYDIAADTWSSKAPMLGGRYALAAAVVDGKIYTFGGARYAGIWLDGPQPLIAVGSVEVYDPATDTWAPRRGSSNRRFSLGAAAVGGKIYVIGGTLQNEPGPFTRTGLVEVYDPVTDSWETKTPMPTVRSGLAIGAVNDKIYAIGGYYYNSSSDRGNLSVVEEYDPSTDSWKTMAPMSIGRSGSASGVVHGEIYVMDIAINEKFNPLANVWLSKTPSPVSSSSGVAVNDKLYVITSSNPQTMYMYDPDLDP